MRSSRTLALRAILALLLFSFVSAGQAQTAAALGWDAVTASTLPNGLHILVAPSRAADLVTLDIWMEAGTRRETPQNNGAAHFLEHLLFKGTMTRKPGEIDAAIENLGGTLNAATSYDWAHFYVTVDASDAEAALDVLSDAIMHAALRPEDMDAERPVILNEMAREQSSPTERLTRAFNARMFPDHPYGRPIMGTTALVSEMPWQTVSDFYHAYYVPGNATLVISGNVTPEAGVGMARKALGGWAARPVAEDKVAASAAPTEIQTQTLLTSGSKGYLILGFRAPSVRDKPDAYVMDVLLTRLGQGGASSGLLAQDLQRRRKLVTAITASYLTQHDPGALSIQAQFDPGDADRVRDAILNEIMTLRTTPLSDAELAGAKHALLASYLFDAQTTSGRADALGFYSAIDTYLYDTRYVQNFESVTAAQVQAVAQKYLDPKAYVLVMLLPPINPVTASRRTKDGIGL